MEIREHPDVGKFDVFAELSRDKEGKLRHFRHRAGREEARNYGEAKWRLVLD